MPFCAQFFIQSSLGNFFKRIFCLNYFNANTRFTRRGLPRFFRAPHPFHKVKQGIPVPNGLALTRHKSDYLVDHSPGGVRAAAGCDPCLVKGETDGAESIGKDGGGVGTLCEHVVSSR